MLLIWEQNASIIGILKEHNRWNFWEICESILGKFLSIFDTGQFSKRVHIIDHVNHKLYKSSGKSHLVESSVKLKIVQHIVWLS